MGCRVLVLVCVLGACVEDSLVPCGDLLCPAETVCDPIHQACVEPARTTACEGLADGDRCDGGGLPGICDRGYCLAGCGDGQRDTGEECDDGNFASHDGCSSACFTEIAGWTRWPNPWTGRVSHAASFHPLTGIVLFGGAEDSGLRDDQWHRTGNGVWTRHDVTAPPARRAHAMAYDSLRTKIVLFGGTNGTDDALDDTWEFDGTAWTKATPATKPSPRSGAAMVFDPVRNRIVLFGGLTNGMLDSDTWEYDGTTWTRIITTPSPNGRLHASMTWDVQRQRAVLFGGLAPNGLPNDTWEYANGTWTRSATTGPPGRIGAVMAYSPLLQRPVLFGGIVQPTAVANDTWEYGAGGWVRVSGGSFTPPARYFASFTAAGGGRLVLVGGAKPDGRPNTDVWEYDGTWIENSPMMSPSPRQTTVAYDEAEREIVLFGGTTITPLYDTWLFDGTDWTLPTIANAPTSRDQHAMAYDAQRKRVVMFGGSGGVTNVLADTYEWNGATREWTKLTFTVSPAARYRAAMAYDKAAGVVVLFGGQSTSTLLADTWEYDGSSWTAVPTSTSPPAGGATTMAYDEANARIVAFTNSASTWQYKDRTWQRLQLAESPPARFGGNLVFDPKRRRVVLSGGVGLNYVYYPEQWELVDDRWKLKDIAGEPPEARYDASLAALPTHQALMLFGGNSSAGPRGDTWFLRYESLTPDEVCDNGIDDDSDRHVDTNDPDCN